jgi:hypothetical protein
VRHYTSCSAADCVQGSGFGDGLFGDAGDDTFNGGDGDDCLIAYGDAGEPVPAQDADGQVFCYSNADIRKGEESEEIFRFISFWTKAHGSPPKHLVFDSRLTTYPKLARLDRDHKITFITLRRKSPALMREIALLPASAWRYIL